MLGRRRRCSQRQCSTRPQSATPPRDVILHAYTPSTPIQADGAINPADAEAAPVKPTAEQEETFMGERFRACLARHLLIAVAAGAAAFAADQLQVFSRTHARTHTPST